MSSQNHTTVRLAARTLALALAVAAGGAHADAATPLAGSVAGAALRGDAAASVGAEQRLRAELRAVMTELVESGAFGSAPPHEIRLDIDAPAQRVSNLGLLVDSARDDRDGVHVLGITPGGAAEKMGLRSGDVLLAVNGTTLANTDGAAATLRQSIEQLPDGARLAFEVQRDGRRQTLAGTPSSVYLPAMHLTVGDGTRLASNGGAGAMPAGEAGCGRLSDFDVAPRGEHLHAAKIISIDGVSPGPTGTRAFRVSAGRHSIKVAEQIESRYLSFNDRARNSAIGSDRYKTLDVDVPPDTTVLIAARLNEDKRSEWKDGAYWDPVAWKQTAEACH
ncbi:PDZ domain-containing protein [Dokdonella fugitiva]|jgi:membrane-associated protease RseP (regulator of RpoE activity)|uniref:PDZ domain-containing protein n=1 Tax=Dokdonella fugitiva TaxID=328517 RepID=A0A4R2IGP0_9GAMM|nr:PDZ domain-containing protein [Dokdonella fugitiva]MBA8882621.1 membrane-associated protease RseP (regulator of RpoE activity) [Dokdonella fugitiva]TCO43402.1 PDZ domain-containing protein [Dokdonella fugitiva]